MKKPDITPGEWVAFIGGTPEVSLIATTPRKVQIGVRGQKSEHCLRNAKAMSATPELIDDALRKYEWMIQLKYSHPHLVPDEEIEITKQALIKAGCTDE